MALKGEVVTARSVSSHAEGAAITHRSQPVNATTFRQQGTRSSNLSEVIVQRVVFADAPDSSRPVSRLVTP
jgi:hypothetical protein